MIKKKKMLITIYRIASFIQAAVTNPNIIYYNTRQIKAANRHIWEAGTSTFDTDVWKMTKTINGLLWSLNFRD